MDMDDVGNDRGLYVGEFDDGALVIKDDSHTRQDLGHFICATASLHVSST